MDMKTLEKRLLQILEEERLTCGIPRGEIDEQLDHRPGYLVRLLNGRVELNVKTLFKAMKVLKLDPVTLLTRVFRAEPRVDVEHVLVRLERRQGDPGPPILETVEDFLVDSALTPLARPASDGHDSELRAGIEELDSLRLSDIKVAAARISPLLEQSLERVEAELTGENLAILSEILNASGAVYQSQALFKASARCFRLSFEASRRLEDPGLRARLLHRAANLIGDDGEYGLAGVIANQAVTTAVISGDLTLVGKCLVRWATMLSYQGEARDSIQGFESALGYLPSEAWAQRCAALQGLGIVHHKLGKVELAREYLQQAKSAHQLREGLGWAKLSWLEGEVELSRSDLPGAEKAFRSAKESFDQDYPLETVLLSLSLAKVFIKQQRRSELQELAAELIGQTRCFSSNKLVRDAIEEFAVGVLRGEMTECLTEDLQQQIEKMGASNSWKHPHS